MALSFVGWTAALVIAAGVTASAEVRSANRRITALITRANGHSQTFRQMTETINASDGIVYVEVGTCGSGLSACFTHVTIAGEKRILWRAAIRRRSTWFLSLLSVTNCATPSKCSAIPR